MQAENDIVALDLIAQRGLTPIDLTEGGHSGPWWSREINLFGASSKTKPAELERFFTSFSALMQAKFPLPRILGYCETQTKDRTMKRALGGIRTSVENGTPLGQAMRDAGGVFPDRFTTLIATGEASNKLAEISASAATLLSSEEKLKRELRGALVYPIILLIMSALVLSLVVFYLAPTLMPVFATADAEPPVVLRFMNTIRNAILSGWPIILTGIAAIVLILYALRTKISVATTALLMRLPLTGRYLKQRETLRLCQSLHLMLTSGASLPQSLAAAQEGASFPAYRQLLADTKDRITAGGTLSESLCTSPLIDDMASALIQAGEESDRLADVLQTAVTSLSDSTSQTLNQMIRMLTPLLTLIIGVGVGAVILSTISAIMDLNDIAF
ncbi:type II secretion system F family protein [Profundibacter sp.]